jgi:hypothetical protein
VIGEIIMKLNGEEFYKHFFCSFQMFVKNSGIKWSKFMGSSEWTSYVKDDFLDELAQEFKVEEIKKEGVHAIDVTWENSSDGILVAIEHENDINSIWANEVKDLLKTAAPLKVLITYIDDMEFPGQEVADKLLHDLKARNFSQEFLLILGSCSMEKSTDWVGYLFKPEITCKTLVYCSNILQAENSPGKKASKTRKANLLEQQRQKEK